MAPPQTEMAAGLTLYPAIDLKDGAAVRLVKGDPKRATLYNPDPAAQARRFAGAGCRWLHVVDLDGAFSGRTENAAAVEAILHAVTVPLQLGGGIRDLAAIERWLELGVARVVLGTAAVKDPRLVETACRRFEGRVAVGIDARGGRVAVEGWAETSDLSIADLALRFEDAGVAALIFTDIERDGTMAGVDTDAVRRLAESVSIPVIASGGVRALDDLEAISAAASRCRGRIEGVIVGRALYDGALDLEAALDLLERRC